MTEDTWLQFEGYELSPAARSLMWNGRPIVLNPRTFDLLVYLATHAQQVVSKDELLSALWPGSFVEEGNLSQHVFLLRKALAANGNSGGFIITLPGRGYQFIPHVELVRRGADYHSRSAVSGSGNLVLHAVESITRVVVEEKTDDNATPALPTPRWRTLQRWSLASTAAVLLLAAAAWFVWHRTHPPPVGPIDAVLAQLENNTGDADFDHTLQRALQIDLEQTPFLNLVSQVSERETLAEMQQPADARLTLVLSREICERDHAQVLLSGSIAKLGKVYSILLGAESCTNGEQLAGARVEATSKEAVLRALDIAVDRLRKRLGESAASLQRFQTPVAQVSTASLEALRDYSQAQESFYNGDEKTAQTLLEHAITLDPDFASAYAGLASSFYNRGDFLQASAYYKKAFDLRARTTERERLNLETEYYAYGLQDYERAIRSLQMFLEIYPQSPNAWGTLCNLYTQLGEYPQAIDAGEHIVRMDPHSGFAAVVLARAYKRANRFQEAKQTIQKAFANGKDTWGMHSILFQIAYVEQDAVALKTDGEWGFTHQHENESLDDLGMAAATSGRLHEATADLTRAYAESLRDGDSDFADAILLELAGVLEEMGDSTQAKAYLKNLHTGGGDPAGLALLSAEVGNLGPAKQFAETVNPLTEQSTLYVNQDLPMLRAELALKAHDPAKALQFLEPARTYQLRDFSAPYMFARVETSAGRFDLAARDYRLILANQGVDPISPLYPISHLALARVLAMQKQRENSLQEYRVFFKLWKDADPDLPLLIAARHEYASLTLSHP
ncbi:MAG: tetratricopeptide repeat protein [Acidobacteriaceae bacterium]